MGVDFEWPWQYSFPPFFTIQPNLSTREKQLQSWQNLILSYCKHHRIVSFSTVDAATHVLFNNKSIQRGLSPDELNVILEHLKSTGHLRWLDKKRSHFNIAYHSAAEWGRMVYAWAQKTGHTGSVCTIYELVGGDDTTEEEFYGVDEKVLLEGLRTLEAEGKAELIGVEGVKFF